MSLLTHLRPRKSNVDMAVQYGPRSLGGGHYSTEWLVDDHMGRWVRLVSTPTELHITDSAGHRTILLGDADPTDVINGYLEEL